MFRKFRQRSLELERLDTGDYDEHEYARWQKEMWFIHRLFGEVRALRRSLLAEIRSANLQSVSVLDVGAGSGEILSTLKEKLSGKNMLVGIEVGQEAVKSIGAKGFSVVRADAVQLPFADQSFDYAFCTLLLHHLNEDAAMKLLQEMQRVARKRIFVIDLERRASSYYIYRLLGRVLLQRFTFDDGSLSIRRSFTRQEMLDLGEKAALQNFRVQTSAIGRLIASAGVKNGN